ncbi:GNAT superfamily N-acetyltransferase [Allocatelliglobosispora scoriae]|uniref:GNAT superfamily N-acetyltransferase n=1 Tax=Allocatelliglobosispora scoriae TaxID=643052 RepID=A0A841C480_9ACTN|nr:GNAT family N-acetyltransferase [Allocatelliglobosispora scoriae]MBB5874109.1 GNAT superfamily N-acetyltransferase [Allocatelliglobosispora scoriae]
MTTFRTAGPDDVERYLALRNLVFPHQVNTIEGVRHFWRNVPADEHLRLVAAERDGQLVGFSRAGLNTWSSEEGTAIVFVLVHPDHRGQGIGTQLLAQAEEHLRGVGGTRMQGWSADDAETMRWLASHGFTAGHELRYSAIGLDALPPVPSLPAGVTTATFAELGPAAVYAVDSVATLDEPGDIPNDRIDYDKWLLHVWDGPELDKELSVGVLVDGVPAAVTLLEVDRPTGRGWSGGTGTLREYRGRGLAKIAKGVCLHRAAAHGVVTAYTSNDEVNGPMLAINEWLGYRPVATGWSQLKAL